MSFDSVTIECFLAAAESQSFTKATKIVNKSQSAISQQISKLEDILGKELFMRDKTTKLTRDGELFLDYAKQIYALSKEALDRFKEPEMKGEVRFGLPEDFASTLLADVLVKFSRIHPQISLKVECDLTLNLYKRFKNNKLDLALLKMSKPTEFEKGINVLSEDLVWVGNSESLNNILKELPRKRILPLITSPKPCVYRKEAIGSLKSNKVKWEIAFESESYASKISALKADLGFGILPRNMVPEDLEILSNKFLPKLRSMNLCMLKNSNKNTAVNSFEKFALSKLRYF